jgi:hypothetical protein
MADREKETVDGAISVSLPSFKDAFGALCTNIIAGLSPDSSLAAKTVQPRPSTIEAAAAPMYRMLFIEGVPHSAFLEEKL